MIHPVSILNILLGNLVNEGEEEDIADGWNLSIPDRKLAQSLDSGSADHRGYDSTKTTISDRFCEMEWKLISGFSSPNVYTVILRLFLASNEVVHYDYALIFDNSGWFARYTLLRF